MMMDFNPENPLIPKILIQTTPSCNNFATCGVSILTRSSNPAAPTLVMG